MDYLNVVVQQPRRASSAERDWQERVLTYLEGRQVQAVLFRLVGIANLALLDIVLVWLACRWYPLNGVSGFAEPAAGMAIATTLGIVALWTVPWERLPTWTSVPILLLGLADVTLLIVATQRPIIYQLPFCWVVFAAVAYRARFGSVAIGLIVGLRLWLALSFGRVGEYLDVLLVFLPGAVLVALGMPLLIGQSKRLLRGRSLARQTADQLQALSQFFALLNSDRTLDQLMTALMAGLAERFHYRFVSIFLLQGDTLHLQAQIGYTTPITKLRLGQGITGLVAQQGQAMLVRDGRQSAAYLFAEDHFGSQASVPLLHQGQVLGVVNLEGAVDELAEEDLRLLETLANPVAFAVANATLVRQLADLAQRDPLTQLLNRSGILAVLERALDVVSAQSGVEALPFWARAPVTILLIDLDNFRAINARYGHSVGDALLCEFAQLLASGLQQEFPRDDLVGRLGSDEFLVILPGLDEQAAAATIERLSTSLRSRTLALPLTAASAAAPVVSCKLGAATAPNNGSDTAALLAAADQAMYRAARGITGSRSISVNLLIARALATEPVLTSSQSRL
jgi:diguanylate cyclase (GGDEF)-like protein